MRDEGWKELGRKERMNEWEKNLEGSKEGKKKNKWRKELEIMTK